MKEIELVKELYNYSNIYLYGAGECATTLSYLLDRLNKLDKINGYIVSKNVQTAKMFGKMVYLYEDILSGLREDDLVIVALSEEKWGEIKELLYRCPANIMWISNEDMRYYRNYVKKGNPENLYLLQEEILDRVTLYNSVGNAKWIVDKDFEPGGMAVSGKYLFLLYKILQSGKFKSFLDIGLGQTTKLISQYLKCNEKAECIVVEADKAWGEFFKVSNDIILDNMKIKFCNYILENYKDSLVRQYEKFENALENRKFDYISIDAPLGTGMTEYSRVDILKVLPQCLDESWIIMMDDINRNPERNTLELIKEKLEESNIRYIIKDFYGYEKDFTIIASEDNVFFTTI